jgi:hypothetical protein
MRTTKKWLALLALALASLNVEARNVTLAWDYEPDVNVVGFTVTYYLEGGGTPQTVTVGPTERTGAISVTAGNWEAYVVAVGISGLASDPSNVVDIFLPIPPANLRIVVE